MGGSLRAETRDAARPTRPGSSAAAVVSAAALLTAPVGPSAGAAAPTARARRRSGSASRTSSMTSTRSRRSCAARSPAPGSEAMAVTFVFPTCWPVQRWVVFRFDGTDWRPIVDVGSYLSAPLEAAGSDIRETARRPPARRPALPAERRHARAPVALERHPSGRGPVDAGDARQAAQDAFFNSPRAVGTQCGLSDPGPYAGVRCQSVKTPAALPADGDAQRQRARLDLPGRGNPQPLQPRQLGRGRGPDARVRQQVDVGRFRCASLRTGVKCTLIKTGQGFLISRSQAVRVTP